jgi:muconolactone delta-isomerase
MVIVSIEGVAGIPTNEQIERHGGDKMLFMYIHTHPVEKCLADKPEQIREMTSKFQEASAKAGVKRVGLYVAAHEHTVYGIFETDDIAALETLLTPMTVWGNARIIPVTTMEQVLKP